MTRISVLEFRREASRVIRRLQQGQRLVLTYRGKPVARMEPIVERVAPKNDPIYSLADLAVQGMPSISNEDMDTLIYEK